MREAQRYLEVASLTWVKRLSNQALDLAFRAVRAVFDEAMETVIAPRSTRQARKLWLARDRRRQRQRAAQRGAEHDG